MSAVQSSIAFAKLLEACEAYYYGRKETRECESMMREAIRLARPEVTDEPIVLALIAILVLVAMTVIRPKEETA